MIDATGAWALAAVVVTNISTFFAARLTARPAEMETSAAVEDRLWQRVRDELDRYEAEVTQLRRSLEECTRGRAHMEREMQALRLAVLRLSERVEAGGGSDD